jgi:uncharacterized glyoxalase superfamily protein PhnB
MITNARFVSLYVGDQEKALGFWKDKIGCVVLEDVPYGDGGARWIELRLAKGETYLVIPPPGPESQDRVGTFSNVWFDCDDLDGTYADLSGKGVEFPVPPQEAPWDPSQRWAQFSDPDGNLYGLSQRS